MSANSITNRDDPTVVERLVVSAFGPDTTITATADAGQGRGVFSEVRRLTLDGPAAPPTAVAKLPAPGPNGEAAIASGAVDREFLAYSELLGAAPARHPSLLSHHVSGPAIAFLFEDLGNRRAVDQLDGLTLRDAVAVAHTAGVLHRHFRPAPPPEVRSNTPALFEADGLAKGHALLESVWELDSELVAVFGRLLEQRDRLLTAFNELPPTLCHGDLRADNLVFDPDDVPVLFDWQQIAVQTGGADIAWLLSTSLEPDTRRAISPAVTSVYAEAARISDTEARHAIVVGHLLPGTAVLMLAQRTPDSPRTAAFIKTSIARIAEAVAQSGLVDR